MWGSQWRANLPERNLSQGTFLLNDVAVNLFLRRDSVGVLRIPRVSQLVQWCIESRCKPLTWQIERLACLRIVPSLFLSYCALHPSGSSRSPLAYSSTDLVWSSLPTLLRQCFKPRSNKIDCQNGDSKGIPNERASRHRDHSPFKWVDMKRIKNGGNEKQVLFLRLKLPKNTLPTLPSMPSCFTQLPRFVDGSF